MSESWRFVTRERERARAYVNPVTGETNLPKPPYTKENREQLEADILAAQAAQHQGEEDE